MEFSEIFIYNNRYLVYNNKIKIKLFIIYSLYK